jgi:prophage maintenance system killer protein
MNSISLFSPIYIQDENLQDSFKPLRHLEGLFQIGDKSYTVRSLEGKTVMDERQTSSTFLQTVIKVIKFVLCLPLLPFKLIYRFKNEALLQSLPKGQPSSNQEVKQPEKPQEVVVKKPEAQTQKVEQLPKSQNSPLAKLTLTPDQTGSGWLTREIKAYVEETNDKRESDCLSFAYVNTECRNKKDWDFSNLFKSRTLTAQQVETLSVEEILDLSSDDFFAIIDLISGQQALEILRSKEAGGFRKMGLYFFNLHLSNAFAEELRVCSEASVDQKVQKAAQEAFLKYKKYPPESLSNLQTTEAFQRLEQARMKSSDTLETKGNAHQTAWRNLNREYLADGLTQPLTKELLEKINNVLRTIPDIYLAPEVKKTTQTELGLRKSRDEVSDPNRQLFYLPGHAVKREIESLIGWINQEIEKCDRSQSNPIVVAALAYQKFVSIHPFFDGNGRTGRLLADLILRRYQLLPAAWKEQYVAINICKEKQETPITAVEKMLQALDQSYAIIEGK